MAKKIGEGYLPQARYVGPDDELRFGQAEYQGGRVYPVSPEAAARLRAHCEAEREARAARRKLSGRRIVLSQEQLEDAAARHEAGESLAVIAAELGVSLMTLVLRLQEFGHDTSRRPGKGRRGRREVKR